MGVDAGRLNRIYLGQETEPGTGVAATVKLPLREPSKLDGKHEPIPIDTIEGRRYVESSSVMGKRWGEGDIPAFLDAVNSGHWLKLGFGNEVLTNVAAGVNDHNFYPTVSGNTPLTGTIFNIKGSTDVERYTYVCVSTLEVNAKDGAAELDVSVLGKWPDIGMTEPTGLVVASGTIFSFRDYTVKFGANIAAAEAASASPMNSLKLSMENDVEAIYRSNQGDAQLFRMKGCKVTGAYEAMFETVAERNKFRELSKDAMVVQFNGINLGGGYAEFLKFRFAKIRRDEGTTEAGTDDFYVVSASYAAEQDLTQVPNVFDCVLRNGRATAY